MFKCQKCGRSNPIDLEQVLATGRNNCTQCGQENHIGTVIIGYEPLVVPKTSEDVSPASH